MDWSPQQSKALQNIGDWYETKDRNQTYRLFGYAGTGKTTLANEIAAGIGGRVLFATYTGKAAHVLRRKGCNASTIHQLIYRIKEKNKDKLSSLKLKMRGHPNGNSEIEKQIANETKYLKKLEFELNEESTLATAKLLIIDECSMVDERIGRDLMSFGVPILVMGDPAQLPPVKGAGFFTNAQPNFMLTEIHRQAKDNPIIRLATEIREHQRPQHGHWDGLNIVKRAEEQTMLDADQVIVGLNRTRIKGNKRMRELLDFDDEFPEVDDKIICLRNNHKIGLLNGSQWLIYDIHDISSRGIEFKIRDIDDPKHEIDTDSHMDTFLGKELDWQKRMEANEFTFGYSITCHKAQGSQWDNVVVVNESYAFRDDSWKWLYTAVTRAAKKLTLIIA